MRFSAPLPTWLRRFGWIRSWTSASPASRLERRFFPSDFFRPHSWPEGGAISDGAAGRKSPAFFSYLAINVRKTCLTSSVSFGTWSRSTICKSHAQESKIMRKTFLKEPLQSGSLVDRNCVFIAFLNGSLTHLDRFSSPSPIRPLMSPGSTPSGISASSIAGSAASIQSSPLSGGWSFSAEDLPIIISSFGHPLRNAKGYLLTPGPCRGIGSRLRISFRGQLGCIVAGSTSPTTQVGFTGTSSATVLRRTKSGRTLLQADIGGLSVGIISLALSLFEKSRCQILSPSHFVGSSLATSGRFFAASADLVSELKGLYSGASSPRFTSLCTSSLDFSNVPEPFMQMTLFES